MNSSTLKAIGMMWLRFGKRLPMVATEAGYWNCDIVGLDDKNLIEIETKISRSDLKAEANKNKHSFYRMPEKETHRTHWTPNYFYFLVPEALAEDAIKQCEALNARYGVLILSHDRTPYDYGSHKHLKCHRRAQRLHELTPTEGQKKTLIYRMSSEICGLRIKNHWDACLMETMKRMGEFKDVEEETPSL